MKKLFIALAIAVGMFLSASLGWSQQAPKAPLTDQERVANIESNLQAAAGQLQFIDQQIKELLEKRRDLNQQIGVNSKAKYDLQQKIKTKASESVRDPKTE